MQDTYLSGLPSIPMVPVCLADGAPTVWCKLEFLNPSGSIKDRIARFMLRKALRSGQLQAGGHVVEASSGSTSIAMALTAAQLGLKFTAIMPEGVSAERLLMIEAYGAAIELTPKAEGIAGALNRAQELVSDSGAFWPQQFSNQDNVETHRRCTAQEIICAIPGGDVDAVVSGVGTGGTLVGIWKGLHDHGSTAIPVAARPSEGHALAEVECCSFSSRIPGVVDGLSQLYRPDELPGLVVESVADELALQTTRQLIRQGFPVGPSSGLNFAVACQLIASDPVRYRHVVTVFPDRMERYFSTELFAHKEVRS